LYFTNRAELKISIYALEKESVLGSLQNRLLNCYNLLEKSFIQIIEINRILFAVVMDNEEQRVITIYRTDKETRENRKKNGRWKCK